MAYSALFILIGTMNPTPSDSLAIFLLELHDGLPLPCATAMGTAIAVILIREKDLFRLDWLQCIGQSDEAIRGFKLNMLLYELLSLLYSRFVSGVRRPELVRSGRNITMQIIGYMTSHRKQHLEATDVAREFGYGREHFCRLFRKATGKTFKEFLTDLRLDDACRKLSGSSASIASIARECGFPDTRALQTAVQRKYGIRAQEYRERYENRN